MFIFPQIFTSPIIVPHQCSPLKWVRALSENDSFFGHPEYILSIFRSNPRENLECCFTKGEAAFQIEFGIHCMDHLTTSFT